MKDIKSIINLQDMKDARVWALEVMEKRPYRVDVFKVLGIPGFLWDAGRRRFEFA